MSVLVVDEAHAEGIAASPCLRRVPRHGRRRSRSPSPDAVVDALIAARPRCVVLAVPAAGSGHAAPLAEVARIMRVEIVRLPPAHGLAGWIVALADWLCRAEYPQLTRRLQTLAGVDRAGLPCRPWGAAGLRVPALRPAVLARWAWHAWRACPACPGGGHVASPCARCGRAR